MAHGEVHPGPTQSTSKNIYKCFRRHSPIYKQSDLLCQFPSGHDFKYLVLEISIFLHPSDVTQITPSFGPRGHPGLELLLLAFLSQTCSYST